MKFLIKVWPFDHAPKKYQKLSNNGGDEDWVILIPKDYIKRNGCCPYWVEELDTCRRPQYNSLPNGDMLVIGSHA
jgi:hypothetical protein